MDEKGYFYEVESEDTPQDTIKVVVVGDDGVGRTRFLATLMKGAPLEEQEWSDLDGKIRAEGVHRPFIKNVELNGTKYYFACWDSHTNDRLRTRQLSYPCANAVIIFYAIDNRESFEYPGMKEVLTAKNTEEGTNEIKEEEKEGEKEKEEENNETKKEDDRSLLEEIKYFLKEIPIMLVGCKSDVTNRAVTTKEGEDYAEKIGAKGFFEISNITAENLWNAFVFSAELGLEHHNNNISNKKTLNSTREDKDSESSSDSHKATKTRNCCCFMWICGKSLASTCFLN